MVGIGSTGVSGRRVGGVAIAVGACGLPLAAQASVVTYTTSQNYGVAVVGLNTSTFAADPTQTSQFSIPGAFSGTSSGDLISVKSATNNLAVKYNAGSLIGANAFNGSTGTPSNAAGLSFPESPYFIGLEIQLPGVGTPSVIYGYAEIGLNQTGGGALLEYGFQTDGTSIAAGAAATPSSVPEPGSLALLAMGAAGVGTIRRRKKAH